MSNWVEACEADDIDEEDVIRSYDLGVNSFITKPVTFGSLVEVMGTWGRYWFEIVELPGAGATHE